MADERLKHDDNMRVVLGGVTDDSAQDISMLRVDPTTKRLRVICATVAADEIVDADADTKVQVEEGADDDTIRFDAAGSEIGNITSAGLQMGGANARITTIYDEDDMHSNSATALATQQSIKAYVDSQVGTVNSWSEILALGNASGATDAIITAGQKITTDTIAETTSAAGVTIDSLLIKDNTIATTGSRATAGYFTSLYSTNGLITTGGAGRDADNKLDWGTDDSLAIVIGGTTHNIVSITNGAADNDKLVTQGYVDDAIPVVGANTALSNLASVAINTSLVSDTDVTDSLGTGDIRWKDAWIETISSGLTAADVLKLRGYDVNGTAYVDILTITSNNTVTADLNALTTIGGSAILYSGGVISGTTLEATATNSLNLGTGSSATGQIVLKNSTNNNTITLQPGATSASQVYTLPIAVGGAGTVLTDAAGNGTLSWAAAAGAANTALSNLAAVAINTSLVSDTDVTDDLGTGDIRWGDAWVETLNSGLTAADTLKLRGYDVNGTAYVDVLTITSNNTVTADLNSLVTIGGSAILYSGGALGTPASGTLTNCTGLPYSGLANGTDGELITWDSSGVAAVVATGTSGHVLTSNGAGAAPTFQSVSGSVAMPKAFSLGYLYAPTLSLTVPQYSDDANYIPAAEDTGRFYVNGSGYDAYQWRDDTSDWADSDAVGGIIKLGSYIYVHMWDAGGTENRVYRYAKDDIAAGGTQMTISGTSFGTNSITAMLCDGTNFWFNRSGGTTSNLYDFQKYTLSGTTLTASGSTVSCGSTATHWARGVVMDNSSNFYCKDDGADDKIRKYGSDGTLLGTGDTAQSDSVYLLANFCGSVYMAYNGVDADCFYYMKL